MGLNEVMLIPAHCLSFIVCLTATARNSRGSDDGGQDRAGKTQTQNLI